MGQKVKFVLSDLHLEAGDSGDGSSKPETGLADNQFIRFLNTIIQDSEDGGQEIELILNGDFLDFLQVPAVQVYQPTETYPLAAYLDSSEAASVLRLEIIYNSHRPVFEALSNFMQITAPQRRLTVIKGNHDVHFFWPRVKSRLRELLNASGTRSSLLLFAEEFVSREKIYVEHGHQRAEMINRYPDFRNPLQPNDPTQLDYPLGSRLLIELSPQINRTAPFITRIRPITTLIWCALEWDLTLAANLLTKLIESEPITAGPDSAALGEPLLLSGQGSQNEFDYYRLLQHSMTNPQRRQQMIQQIQRLLTPPGSNDHQARFEAEVAEDQPLLIAQVEQQRSNQKVRDAAETIAEQEGAQIVLFGHTHSPCQETLSNGAIYVNTGCWAEDLSGASPDTWAELFRGGVTSAPPSRLPYARIDYDADNSPSVQLLDFTDSTPSLPPTGLTFSQKVIEWLSRWRSDRQA